MRQGRTLMQLALRPPTLPEIKLWVDDQLFAFIPELRNGDILAVEGRMLELKNLVESICRLPTYKSIFWFSALLSLFLLCGIATAYTLNNTTGGQTNNIKLANGLIAIPLLGVFCFVLLAFYSACNKSVLPFVRPNQRYMLKVGVDVIDFSPRSFCGLSVIVTNPVDALNNQIRIANEYLNPVNPMNPIQNVEQPVFLGEDNVPASTVVGVAVVPSYFSNDSGRLGYLTPENNEPTSDVAAVSENGDGEMITLTTIQRLSPSLFGVPLPPDDDRVFNNVEEIARL